MVRMGDFYQSAEAALDHVQARLDAPQSNIVILLEVAIMLGMVQPLG
jgi:hypothetical protein